MLVCEGRSDGVCVYVARCSVCKVAKRCSVPEQMVCSSQTYELSELLSSSFSGKKKESRKKVAEGIETNCHLVL